MSNNGDIMYIVDMHCDSLTRVAGDTGLVGSHNFSGRYPQLQFAAAFVPKGKRTLQERKAELMQYFNVYLSEKERLGLLGVRSSEDVYRFEEDELRSTLFSVEGGAGLMPDSKELMLLASGGLAVLGMAWDTNELATSAWDKNDTGLTLLGKEMVRRCDSLGIISDVSHLSDKSFYDLMDTSGYPVLATHSNFRDICPSPRNLTRDMAKMIVARGGVIGINLYPEFLREDGACTEDIIRHVDYALENFGDSSIGFGFDIDGTEDRYPLGIRTDVSIHDQVIELLLGRYSVETVEKIAGKNVMNFLKSNLS